MGAAATAAGERLEAGDAVLALADAPRRAALAAAGLRLATLAQQSCL